MTFTKTETLRRLRVLATEARTKCGLPANSKCEIGERNMPQTATTLAEAATHDRMYPEGDDLFDFTDLPGASGTPDIRREGSLVHLYLYTSDPFMGWELEDVCVGWIGTAESAPRLLDTNGRPLAL